jgi:hypothetical protein
VTLARQFGACRCTVFCSLMCVAVPPQRGQAFRPSGGCRRSAAVSRHPGARFAACRRWGFACGGPYFLCFARESKQREATPRPALVGLRPTSTFRAPGFFRRDILSLGKMADLLSATLSGLILHAPPPTEGTLARPAMYATSAQCRVKAIRLHPLKDMVRSR